jgi:hypothetical protein
MPPLILTIVGDGAAIMVSHGVIRLVVTSTGRRSTGRSLSRNGSLWLLSLLVAAF